MLAEERYNAILKLVNEKGTVTVQDLTTLLNTSESTIRRDLTTLHRRGVLIKVHGGATTVAADNTTRDASLFVRQDRNREEKVLIGQYAASLIGKDDFVYLDAGSSVEQLVDCLSETNAVYVTNAIGHAKKLLKRGCRVILPGGELKETTEAIVGAETLESIGKYNFTKGFFGTNGVDVQAGFTTPDVAEALVKEKAMQQCKLCYVLADSSKIAQVSAVTFGAFESAQVLTTALKEEAYHKFKNIKEIE